jgi:cation transport ATPase
MNDLTNIEDDEFLKSLITSDGLESPSVTFTEKLMAKILQPKTVVQESSRLIGKNFTLIIFLLVGLANILLFYFIWPYLTVWMPENSFFVFAVTNIKIFVQSHLISLMQRSASLSLLIIIGLGTITIFGKDEIFQSFQKITRRFSI